MHVRLRRSWVLGQWQKLTMGIARLWGVCYTALVFGSSAPPGKNEIELTGPTPELGSMRLCNSSKHGIADTVIITMTK
ncbi:hypothetical protein PAXRUDRAFT_596916 [Paxillus rubicundulus Ve08.2h10]|uniref:Uncharacterized protein n=1 Tax=Paxillus rubicundulus Ve08.2h10 TaxID=930991 RepID=A0A0D0E4B7_9AGAM|nr:hypothetical protein PAXRUDRAFT_596916 [Paxillus rubicundulus Ve08.2h10]